MTNETFQQHYLLSNGMAHMAYRAGGIGDIICHYSYPGYETLSEEFVATFDDVVPHIPAGTPVVLEISGCTFTAEEQALIERTIWNHYHIRLSGIRHANRRALIHSIWFTLSFILSAVLLFLVDDNTENVLVQYAYLPFWYFGYRVLMYLFVDLVPQMKSTRQAAQLAGMKVFFSGDVPLNEVPDGKADAFTEEVQENLRDLSASSYHKMVDHYLMEADGTASLACTVTGMDDVVRATCVKGYEMLNQELEGYIDQQLPYVPEKAQLRLELEGAAFTDEEQASIRRAVSSFFAYRVQSAREELAAGLRRIAAFVALMVAATILLFATEHTADKATLELITMFFWLIGDYLIDYVVVDLVNAIREKRRMTRLSHADVVIEK